MNPTPSGVDPSIRVHLWLKKMERGAGPYCPAPPCHCACAPLGTRRLYLQQRTNTIAVSLSLSCSHRYFSVDVSVFWGTPPAKPLNCKFKLNSFGDIAGAVGFSVSICQRLFRFLIASTSIHFIIPSRFLFPFDCSGFSNKKSPASFREAGLQKLWNAPLAAYLLVDCHAMETGFP